MKNSAIEILAPKHIKHDLEITVIEHLINGRCKETVVDNDCLSGEGLSWSYEWDN